MGVGHRLGGAIVGGVFGAWYAAFKLAGETIHPLVTRIYQMAPSQYVLIAGAVVFAVAGYNLARYLSVVGVVGVFVAFFAFEFVLPEGSDTLLRWLYVAYLVVPLLLFVTSFRVFVPTTFFPMIR